MDYANGKIYKLVSPHTTDIYVGSTASTLTKRKAGHKKNYTKWKKGKKGCASSFELYELGIEDVDIVLIEKFPCADKMELRKRERYWIEKLNCCNKRIPSRTGAEYEQDNKEKIKVRKQAYYKANKEKISAVHKAYYETNKEKIKAYREANKEKNKARDKAYYETNKEKINADNCKKVTCECGSVVRRGGLTEHKKTKKHKKLMEAK